MDEVVASNAIENIHSSRADISKALKSEESSNRARPRFLELARLYDDFINGAPVVPRTPEDVRRIYDAVMDGELTQFVYRLLDMTSKAQDGLVAQFMRASERLTETGAAIEAYAASHDLSSKESNAVFVLTQATVFSEDGDVSLREISEQLRIGEQMARSHMRKLEKEGIARRVRKRDPITFALTEQFTEAIGAQRFE